MEIDVNQYVVIVRMENFVTQITDHVNLAVFPSFNPLFAKVCFAYFTKPERNCLQILFWGKFSNLLNINYYQ